MNYLVPAQPAWPRSIHDFDATLLALRLNDTFVGLEATRSMPVGRRNLCAVSLRKRTPKS